MSFGSNVKYYRKKNGYTLQDFAKLLNTSTNYLSTLENDNAKIYPNFLPLLSSVLGVQIMDLYVEISPK